MSQKELSDELIALSATALGSDEYVQKRNIFLEQAKGILPKYSGIGIRFNKNPISSLDGTSIGINNKVITKISENKR